jgi:ABC-type nitrate/sulfonate/bicarbonate transport system substrate-binding protein
LTARAAGAQQKSKATFVVTQGTAGLTLLDIAFSQGFVGAQDLDATTIDVSDASKAIAALIGRSSDICLWSGFGGGLAAIERGAPLKIVAGALLFPTNAVFSAKPGIRRIADLAGKTIGVGALGAQLHQVMLAILRKKGVDVASVTFRNVGSSTDVFRAVVAGTVDAGPAEADVFAEQDKYHVHSLDDGDLWIELPDFTWQASYTTAAAIADKRPALVRTLAALGTTYRYVSGPGSQDAWVKSYAKVTGKNDVDEASAQWRFVQKYRPYATDLVLAPERIQYMQQFNVELGVQKRVLPYEQVTDMSLARDALALIR